MKRKGLIVSSIVMVIVLIASLTTATYAWFTSSSTAEIKSMTVQTVASSGLSLSMLTYDNAGDFKYETSGVVAKDLENEGLLKGDVDGSGTVLDFGTYFALQPDSELPVNGYYCASGDGLNMYSAYNYASGYGATTAGGKTAASDPSHVEENKGLAANDIPILIGKASSASYFTVDIAVYNHDYDVEKPSLTLDKFEIIATGPAAGKAIAASSRVAIFAGAAATAAPATYMADPTPVVAFEPYASVYYQGGLKTSGSARPETKHINSAKVDLGTATGTVPYAKATQADKLLSTTFANKLFRHIATETDFSESITQSSTFTSLTGVSKTAENRLILNTYSDTNNVIPLRIVIWFEGEDAECATSLAKGGGIKFTCTFGTGIVKS